MNWIYYLLEANLYLIIFYGFYRLFLAKETFYTINRFYLIIISVLAFILPTVQIGIFKNPIEIIKTVELPAEAFQGNFTATSPLIVIKPSIFTPENILLFIYSLIAIVLISKLLYNIYKILRLKKSANVISQNGIKIIELNNSRKAFSFFKLLFIDSNLDNKNTVIKHEMVHINQKHSYDILFFELIQIANWFNPFIYIIKNDIKLIHEYLADEASTQKDIEKYDYALFLIKNATGFENLKLTNQIFNSSILKQRISMLNQKKSVGWAKLKLLLVLPLIGGIICTSTMAFSKNYGYMDIYSGKNHSKLVIRQDTIKKPFEGTDGIHVPNPNVLYIAFQRDKKSNKVTSITKRYLLSMAKKLLQIRLEQLKTLSL